jgi:hypothetical protein
MIREGWSFDRPQMAVHRMARTTKLYDRLNGREVIVQFRQVGHG